MVKEKYPVDVKEKYLPANAIALLKARNKTLRTIKREMECKQGPRAEYIYSLNRKVRDIFDEYLDVMGYGEKRSGR